MRSKAAYPPPRQERKLQSSKETEHLSRLVVDARSRGVAPHLFDRGCLLSPGYTAIQWPDAHYLYSMYTAIYCLFFCCI